MKRIAMLCLGLCVAAAPMLFEPSAGAVPATRNSFLGFYGVYLKQAGETQFQYVDEWELEAHHQGQDGDGGQLSWKRSGKNVTVTITVAPDVETYTGTKTRAGFNRRGTPGTWTDNMGEAGVWYAVKYAS